MWAFWGKPGAGVSAGEVRVNEATRGMAVAGGGRGDLKTRRDLTSP